jgi:hypothetical protein
MARLIKLEDVLFPVEEHPVYVRVSDSTHERQLSVPAKKAIVNRSSMRVLGIVGRDYRLITNREALDLGLQCSRLVFPDTKPNEWEVHVVDAPATGGYCYFDIVHNSTALDFTFVPAKQRLETFGPFIRVTNSYNTVRALAFDIGFYRKVCKNGLILQDSIIRFAFKHSRRDIGETVQFTVEHERLNQFKKSFDECLGALRDCAIPRQQFGRFVRGVLIVRELATSRASSSELTEWAALLSHIEWLSDVYTRELGENAYAVFNVVTDFASHPPHNRFVRRDRHSLQRLAGAWLAAFVHECRKADFDLDRYSKNLGATATKLESNGNSAAQKQLVLAN